MFIALFGVISLGVFSAYEYATMSEEERFILANIEALTQDEGTGVAYCNIVKEFAPPEEYEWFMPCDSKTSGSMIYPCLKDQVRQGKGKQDRCTTK